MKEEEGAVRVDTIQLPSLQDKRFPYRGIKERRNSGMRIGDFAKDKEEGQKTKKRETKKIENKGKRKGKGVFSSEERRM